MATCKGCGLPCTWAKRGRRWKLLEPNGKRHNCALYRPKKKREPAGEAGPRITGEQFSPGCERCGIPPWQHCSCSALNASERANFEDARLQHLLELAEQA